MGLKPFKAKQDTSDPTFLQRMLAAVQASFDSLSGTVTNDIIVGPVAIGTGDTVVTHNLGSIPTAMDVVDQDANAVIWRSSTVNTRPKTTVILRASAPVNAKFRFT